LESDKREIAVIGSNSMVGSRVCELTKNSKITKADLRGDIAVDITSYDSTEDLFSKHAFSSVILFSAFTDVDAAEKQRGQKDASCWQINVVGAQNVASACKKYNCKLIFISTDFVFDGENGPYKENQKRGGILEKISWYGISKMKAEEICEESLNDLLILRISYPYRGKYHAKIDFAKQIIQLYDEGTLYPMFFDQSISPTFIDDIAPAIDLLIANNSKGIYHLASTQTVSPYEFAKYVVITFNRDPKKIKKASIRDFLKTPGATPRPVNAGLQADKIIKEGFIPTDWQTGIQKIFEQSAGELI